MYNLLNILAGRELQCGDLAQIIRILKWVFNGICIIVPVIIIVLIIIDVTKVATAGNVDDKLKKETGQKAITRLIYAVVIFLVPTIVGLIFQLLPIDNANVMSCWDQVNADGTLKKQSA